MNRMILHEVKERSFISSAPPQPPPYLISDQPPSQLPQSNGFSLNNKVSPSILIIIIILAIIFLISSLLPLLVRLLLRNPNHRNSNNEMGNLTAFQGQLQQLFHLHDSGVDQYFIESTLPTFHYKTIIGLKGPFDCAVCLCEFEPEDNLRLLPKCSHAFHINCIDTWLLSHSTCPLCRTCLLSEYPPNPNVSPIVFVLESQGESSREIVTDREIVRTNSCLSSQYCDVDDDGEGNSLSGIGQVQKYHQIEAKDDANRKTVVGSEEKVMLVKLGKFKNFGEGVAGGNTDDADVNSDARRCFSMGSFAYVMDENSSLQVAVRTPQKKLSNKMNLRLGHPSRTAMSECGCDSRREFNGFEAFRILDEPQYTGNSGGNENVKSIGGNKSESFSISKIWSRGKKDGDKIDANAMDSSRRASSSFRFSMRQTPIDVSGELKSNSNGENAMSEFPISRFEKEGFELSFDEKIITQRCSNILNDTEANYEPSFGRRTLAWLMGRENKVVQSNSSENV